MSARWWTLAVWALAAAGAVFWGLRLFVAGPAAPAQTQTATAGPLARGDLSRLLGVDAPVAVVAAAPEPMADNRFLLIGVVAPRAPQAASEGLALIAVDGKPPRAYRVGSVVEGQTVLQSVAARGATLGPRGGSAAVSLNLSPPPAASTGTLPGLGSPAAAGAPPNAMPQPGAALDPTGPVGAAALPPVLAGQRRPQPGNGVQQQPENDAPRRYISPTEQDAAVIR